MFPSVKPKVDPQIDRRLAERLNKHRWFWILQNGWVIRQYLAGNLLSLIDRIIISDPDRKVLPPIRVSGEVTQRILVDSGIGNLYEITDVSP